MFFSDTHLTEYPSYYEGYLSVLSPQTNLLEELEASHYYFIKFVQDVPMDKFDYRYAEGKWTIKEIIQHLIDSERVYAYRALRFSRNDKTELPGFDENDFMVNCDANKRHLKDLLHEFSLVRHTTLELFRSLSEEALCHTGKANGSAMSVRAIGFMIIAHQEHHKNIFRELYL